MKTKLLLLCVSLCALCVFSGCDKDAAKGLVFETSTVQAGVVQQDSIQAPDGSLIVVTPEMRGVVDPAKIIPAGTPVTQQVVAPTATAKAVVSAVKYLPIPFADVASYALNGLLGIAAVWLTKKKKTSEKVNASLVRGVDTFRDILDQTEGGAKLDAYLTKTLAEQQRQDGVQAAVNFLLDRYMTPAKPSHADLTATALKT
ncbi:hypothetical protein [Opitutus terrae]|uniref:Lipoprotein n=1 Tax=Opitutus terrae (strain DSM 11246 / JCM 15787 / PB90-1) TaxID=452637 RepID=B1ZUC6_OPITP|nr:hypothetical protein [Opitutus terrae]ACB76688.1 hypothetical protein Oter_3411 [Opitutus terrae PB90-1]